jgi:hypothetical protein
MAYDETLARRVRAILAYEQAIDEKKMFGGLAFMLRGNMCCAIIRDGLLVRVGRDQYQATLALPHAHEMDFTGRSMRGFVVVEQDGTANDADLERWVRRGVEFAETLPAKGASAS